MQLDLRGLDPTTIVFLKVNEGPCEPIHTFTLVALVAAAAALNKASLLMMEGDLDSAPVDEDALPIASDLLSNKNDPWLVLGEIMEWESHMEMPTLRQLCFAAGTLLARDRYVEWELDSFQSFRQFPALLLGWHDRATETAHPEAYRLACWMVLLGIIKITHADATGFDEPWQYSMLDLTGVRLIMSRMDECETIISSNNLLGNERILNTAVMRQHISEIAYAIWPGFENYAIDDDGNPIDDDGNLIDLFA